MMLNGTYLFPGGVMAAFRDGVSPSEDVVDQSHTLVVGQGSFHHRPRAFPV